MSVEFIPTDLTEKLTALRQCPYFHSLSQAILEELSQGGRLEHYARGEMILWQDEVGKNLFILRKGSVKLFKLSPHGRELIVNILYEGETFNEVPVFDEGSNPVNAAALEDSEMWAIEAEVIRRAMAAHPEMCQEVVLNLSKNLRRLVHVIEELSFLQVTNRLARLISQLPEEQLAGEAGTRLTQHELAARLGTVREVVARSLRQLERCGAIRINQRQIQVLDRALLLEWAQIPGN